MTPPAGSPRRARPTPRPPASRRLGPRRPSGRPAAATARSPARRAGSAARALTAVRTRRPDPPDGTGRRLAADRSPPARTALTPTAPADPTPRAAARHRSRPGASHVHHRGPRRARRCSSSAGWRRSSGSAASSSRPARRRAAAAIALLVVGLVAAVGRADRRRGLAGHRAARSGRLPYRGPVAVPRLRGGDPDLAPRRCVVVAIPLDRRRRRRSTGRSARCCRSRSRRWSTSALVRLLVVDTGALTGPTMGVRRLDAPALVRDGVGGALWAVPVIVVTAIVAGDPAARSSRSRRSARCRRPATPSGFALSLARRRRSSRRSARRSCSAASPRRPGCAAWASGAALVRGGAGLRLRPRPRRSRARRAGEAFGLAVVGVRARGSRSRSRSAGSSSGAGRSGRRSGCTRVQRHPAGPRRGRRASVGARPPGRPAPVSRGEPPVEPPVRRSLARLCVVLGSGWRGESAGSRRPGPGTPRPPRRRHGGVAVARSGSADGRPAPAGRPRDPGAAASPSGRASGSPQRGAGGLTRGRADRAGLGLGIARAVGRRPRRRTRSPATTG